MNRSIFLRTITFIMGVMVFFLLCMADYPGNGLTKAEKEISEEVVNYNKESCLACHGRVVYAYINEWTDDTVKKVMNPYYRVHEMDFLNSNHGGFKCIDCHSSDYEVFPHSGELKMELGYSCMDCHGGDETFAKYQFDRIQEEYHKSVHYQLHQEDFSCWKCHDPHEYKTMARQSESIAGIVEYNNQICLSCHNNSDKYLLFEDKMDQSLEEIHSWLPNQSLHFTKVRCLECHASTTDDLLVSHNVQPKERAVKKCVECHSTNSLLMASLYRHNSIEERNSRGYFNAIILNESYVIGANRNLILNIISIVIFIITTGGIIIHTAFRIIKNR